jgi:hypothetical protein
MIPKEYSEKVSTKNGKNINENLKENQNRMVTHFNLFANDVQYFKGEYSKHVKPGIVSIFEEIQHDNADCISEGVMVTDCQCFRNIS